MFGNVTNVIYSRMLQNGEKKGTNATNNYGLKSGVNLEAGLNDMPANIFMRLRGQLDTNPADKDWRALARIVENEYYIKPAMIEAFSPAISGQSASAKLLNQLSSRGMTVAELIKYLNHLRIDTFPLGLSPYEEIKIVRCTSVAVEVHEGSPLKLEVEATGQPYPRYQWFFCQNGQDDFIKLQGRVENTLQYDSVTNDDAGNYSCRIHNCGDPQKTKLTSKILVSVTPSPYPLDSGLNAPNKDAVIQSYLGLGSGLQLSPSAMMQDPVGFNQRSRSVSYSLIFGHPRDLTVCMNEPFVLSVETCGDPPIEYQWYRNGVSLDGQFTSKLHVSQATRLDFGRYHCVVRNGYKTEQSNTACVTENIPIPDRKVEILVVSQPKSVAVKFGGCALFSCEVKCCEPLRFQWFKDGVPLQGETTSEIKFTNIQSRSVAGVYLCEISVDSLNSTTPRRLTTPAVLTLEIPSVMDSVEYNPSDKVALLIGNSDYKSETRLSATIKDVQVLTESFKALDFKVVSLLNLTKPEIENAVLHFCELVEKNVYAVFYFCGHGFEEYGVSYFVPTDAPAGYTINECVCAQTILENIQKKDPPFICMIIDICRQGGKVKSNSVPPNLEKLTIKGNTAFCYATSVGLAAYENKHGGLLVSHLSPLLQKNIGIDLLISNLKEEFHREPKHSDRQIPQLVSNLQEPRRSLTDKISRMGQTKAFQMRTLRWMSALEKPPKQDILFTDAGVVIELDFQAEFSNVLHVFVTVTNPGMTESCIGKITNFSPPISQHGETTEYKRGSRVVTNTFLQDIQKLKEDLIVFVTIYFSVKGKPYFLTRKVNLGQPLVAKLRMWEQTPNFTPNAREGIEQGEDTDSYGAAN